MPKRAGFAAGVTQEARTRMASAASQDEFRRWQAIWLADGDERGNDEIARITGLAVTTVRGLHARCRKHGLDSLKDKPVGGRYRFNLTVDQERAVLAPFVSRAARGEVPLVTEIQHAVAKACGKAVHSSGIYKLLKRHGWRKIAPRRRHPDGDEHAQEEFKKTSRARRRRS